MNVAAPPTRAPDAAISYWSIVGAQLRKNRVAMFAWWCVRFLIVVAVAAPLLAFNVPYAVRDESGWSAPLFERLFDRFLFPGGVDVFFNLLLVLGPAWWLASRAGDAWGRRNVNGRGSRRVALPIVCFVLWCLFLGLGVLLGASTPGWILLGSGLPGAAALVLARARGVGPKTARNLRRARAACLVLFVATFALLQGPFRDTRSLVDYRAKMDAATATAGTFAMFPPVPFHPDNVGETGSGPANRSLRRPGGGNLLGCDLNGRDVLARLLFGTRISLTIGVVAVSIYVLIGVFLGGLAGFYRGWVDLLISRGIEVMICFPTLFLILTIIAVFESRSIFLIMGVIGLVGWPGVARLVRGEYLRQSHLDYVTAAQAQGIPERRIIFGHLLPNCMGPVLVSATFGIAAAILTESTLAFLGLGDTTAASWGQMLAAGRTEGMWHLILAPGVAVFFVVFVFNLLGEGVRDALDPKLRR